ncbi:MAG TPA: DUF1003 domain-containing protein [Pedococcus sp.]|nr:DUF1003 domain-containing protein [Pedococcus sp.]
MTERPTRASTARLDQPREVRRAILPRPAMNQETFGVWSERFARFMGTPRFLIYMTAFVLVWIGWNALGPPDLRWDPYAFIFLTLMLSLQASYAAPLILLAQNRQADRDRVALEQDRARDERNLADTEFLTREVAALRLAMSETATRDFVRSELRSLLEEFEERGLEVRALRDEGDIERRSPGSPTDIRAT